MSRDECPQQRRISSLITSCVSPYSSFVLWLFLRALQQNREQSRPLYYLNNIYQNWPVQFCPFPVYPGWQLHSCDPMVLVQFAFSWQEWFPLHSSTSMKSEIKKNEISKLSKKCLSYAITVLKSASHGCFQLFAELREREIVVHEEKSYLCKKLSRDNF